MRNSLFFLLGILLSVACMPQESQKEVDSEVVVKINNLTLYRSDLEKVVDNDNNGDSAIIAQRYIDHWLKRQLVLQVAQMNLTPEEKNVEERVKDYRESLLINQYKQKYIEENLQREVSMEDVEAYVTAFSDNFKLKQPLYRFYFAKIMSKNKTDVWTLYNKFKADEIDLTKKMSLDNTTFFTIYNEDWYVQKDIVHLLPEDFDEKKLNIAEGKVFMTTDKTTTYLIKPIEIRKVGDVSPPEFVYKQVKEIILHKRKIELAKKLDLEIYEDAKKNNRFQIY